MSYGQSLVHGEGTSSSRAGPYRSCNDGNPGPSQYTTLVIPNFVRYSDSQYIIISLDILMVL